MTTTDNTYYLSAAPLRRALAHLCIPMMAAMAVGVVYNLINAWFIGRLNDTAMLAALTFGLPVLTLVMAIGGMFGAGGSSEVARQLGAAETDPAALDRARRVGGFVIYGSLAAGAAIAVVGLFLLRPLVLGLGADASAMPATTRYVGGLLLFAPVMIATFAVDQLVRAEGAAKASSFGMIASTVANFVLDALFILVLHMDVLGAAIGMGVANLLTLGYYLWWLNRHSTVLSIAPKWFSVGRDVVKPVMTVGASELLMSSFLLVSGLVLNHAAVRFGDDPLAAFGLAQRIVQLPEMLAMSLAIGVLPLLAYSWGAGNSPRLRDALRASAVTIGGLVVVMSGVLLVFRDQVFALFSTSPEVVSLGAQVMLAMLISTLFNGFTVLIMTWFQSSEQSGRAATLGIAQGGLFIPVVLVLAVLFGLSGIIWSITVAEALAFVLGLVLAATGVRAGDRPSDRAREPSTDQALPVGGR